VRLSFANLHYQSYQPSFLVNQPSTFDLRLLTFYPPIVQPLSISAVLKEIKGNSILSEFPFISFF
ncbi:hypothetical protein JZU46_07185, partial [bacterium]|nr:hypothetical protein [bacterium]